MRQPYGRAIASTVTYAHPSWYAAHGFLVVVQDVRGRGESEGNFQGFVQEASDGADTVRWVRQLPSCNGRVGTYGFSYQGLSQLLNDAADGEGWPDCLAPAMAALVLPRRRREETIKHAEVAEPGRRTILRGWRSKDRRSSNLLLGTIYLKLTSGRSGGIGRRDSLKNC